VPSLGSIAWRRTAVIAVPALAVAYALAGAALHRGTTPPLTTYAGASIAARALDLLAGLALIAAGVLAWLEPRTRRVGLLAMIAGAAWFGPDWEGWQQGPAIVRTLGGLAGPVVVAIVFHLVATFPRGRLERPLTQAAVLAVYGVSAVVVLVRALFRDPFLDPHCWRNCYVNSFLVHADSGAAQGLDDVWLRSTIAIGVLLVLVATVRLAVASSAARRALWAVLVPGALVGGCVAAYAVALVRNPFENPSESPFSALFLAGAASLTLLALGLAWAAVAATRKRMVVSRLAAELGEAPPPGKLQEALGAAVGDPELRVAYWLPGSRRFVDGEGKPVERPVPAPDRAVTPIVRGGEPVAVVEHDSAVLDGRELSAELGPAATLALDNERLQAELLAQLGDLQASRARIVEAGDAERRRLERDLHDGAQQRLLAVSYDVRLAKAAAEADGDRELATLLDGAGGEAQAALGELRELAHGIYPAILAEAGLGPALRTLADGAPLPVELDDVLDDRFEAATETAAYVAAAEAIGDAAARRASGITIGAARDDLVLVITAEDDGEARTARLVHVADRIGALGGSLTAGPNTLRAVIPCG
jgi:signal transduction histidine kinase